jgi:predicted RNA-binding Zn ribbon-like protein
VSPFTNASPGSRRNRPHSPIWSICLKWSPSTTLMKITADSLSPFCLGSYIWVWDPRQDIQAAILGPITLSALTLLMAKDLLRTKRCAGQECGWLFLDTTKNNRRWCEMRVCGNRAKVRAARQRQRQARKS